MIKRYGLGQERINLSEGTYLLAPSIVEMAHGELVRHKDHIAEISKMVEQMEAIGAGGGGEIGQAIPDGWQLVPKEPTKEMVAAFNVVDEKWEDGGACKPLDHYKSMLAAAPTHKEVKE